MVFGKGGKGNGTNAMLPFLRFDTGNPVAIVSPGGVGFDINCGVRLLRTNLVEKDLEGVKVR